MIVSSIIAATLIITGFSNVSSFAETADYQTEITPISDSIGIEQSTIQMTISDGNQFPWGFVEGQIQNPVEDYPVIIQIFDSDDDSITENDNGAVHFAQTGVNTDGSYEYKFRVLNSENGQVEPIFRGDYTVKVFKVVYLDSNFAI